MSPTSDVADCVRPPRNRLDEKRCKADMQRNKVRYDHKRRAYVSMYASGHLIYAKKPLCAELETPFALSDPAQDEPKKPIGPAVIILGEFGAAETDGADTAVAELSMPVTPAPALCARASRRLKNMRRAGSEKSVARKVLAKARVLLPRLIAEAVAERPPFGVVRRVT